MAAVDAPEIDDTLPEVLPEAKSPVPPGLPVAFVAVDGNDATASLGYQDRPYRSIAAAWKALKPTNGAAAGAIQFRRGEVFDEPLPLCSGLSPDRPVLFGWWGDTQAPRPSLVVDQWMLQHRTPWVHTSFDGLDFYGRGNDPALITAQPTRECKINMRAQRAAPMILYFHDCTWRYVYLTIECGGEGVQNPASSVTLNRCKLLDAWPIAGENKCNLLASAIKIVMDRCVVDRGGWIEDWQTRGYGKPTAFNHGIYLADCSGSRITNSIFSRPSSYGCKLTANTLYSSHDVQVLNNLFLDGEQAIDIGGNVYGVDRFLRPNVSQNVFYNIGKTKRPDRGPLGLAGGIRIWGWRDGVCSHNVMINDAEGYVGINTFFLMAMESIGTTRFEGNVCTGVNSGSDGVVRIVGVPSQDLRFSDHILDVESGTAIAFTGQPGRLGWESMAYEFPRAGRVVLVSLGAGTKPVDSSVMRALAGQVAKPLPRKPDRVLPLPWAEYLSAIRAQGDSGKPWDESLEAPAINAAVRAVVMP